jgi:hypothetical protein
MSEDGSVTRESGDNASEGEPEFPTSELGYRPFKKDSEALLFFGDLELDDDFATLEILAGKGDAVESLRCHASILALRSTEIMQELLLCEEPPTPDEPMVLEVRASILVA